MKKYPKILRTITGLTVILVITFIANAFTEPTQAPPAGNVSAPLNTSATTQTKTGKLLFPWFEDQNQPGYYADPGGNSMFYRLYGIADIRAPIFYDQDNTSYYADPAGTSVFNTIYLGGVPRSSWPGEIPSGMIAMFASGCPSGWTRFTTLDGRFPRGSSSYGGTGGAASHSHTVYLDPFPYAGPGGNVVAPGTYSTSEASNLPPYLDIIFCQKN